MRRNGQIFAVCCSLFGSVPVLVVVYIAVFRVKHGHISGTVSEMSEKGSAYPAAVGIIIVERSQVPESRPFSSCPKVYFTSAGRETIVTSIACLGKNDSVGCNHPIGVQFYSSRKTP
jgi:hypothetical protein